MPFGLRKRTLGSLRFQLTVLYGGAIIFTVVATLLGIKIGLFQVLRADFDELLIEDAMEVCDIIEHSGAAAADIHRDLDRKARFHRSHGFFVQILDDAGDLVWASENAPDTLPKPSPHDVAVADTEHYLVAHRRLRRVGQPTKIIRVGLSTDTMNRLVAKRTFSMLATGAVILAISPFLAYWLAGRATRPLARIISATERLRPSNLNERLPIRGAGDELDQLSDTINGFLDRIAVHLEQKRAFVANAAHELRSPLAAIQNSVEVALNSDRSPEEYKELLYEVVDQCSGLSLLINQLLLLAETADGRIALTGVRVKLDQIITKSLDMFEAVADLRGIDLAAERLDEAVIWGDERHLWQVINNLLDNALKFTNKGGRIRVDLQAIPENQRAILQVIDTGAGISTDDLPHVFERFYRGDKARRRDERRPGTGLGLSICEAIIRAHGGSIHVRSELGSGSVFTVVLPMVEGSVEGQAVLQPIAMHAVRSPVAETAIEDSVERRVPLW